MPRKKLEILLVGTVRDVENTIFDEVSNFKRILGQLGEVSIFLVESDSSDRTAEVLGQIKKEISKFDFVSLGYLSKEYPDRNERLIHCRNRYVHEIRNNPNYTNLDLVIVADLDGINNDLSIESLRASLSLPIPWDGLFANQSGPYYDILALRHKVWAPNNPVAAESWYKPILGPSEARQRAVYNLMLRIPRYLPPIEVDSAYGGLAIYRTKTFYDFDYSRGEGADPSDIDFVNMHLKMRQDGKRLFLIPSLINGSWNEHSEGSLKRVRVLRSLKGAVKKFLSSKIS